MCRCVVYLKWGTESPRVTSLEIYGRSTGVYYGDIQCSGTLTNGSTRMNSSLLGYIGTYNRNNMAMCQSQH